MNRPEAPPPATATATPGPAAYEPEPPESRAATTRRVSAGLIDQAVVAAANAGNGLLAILLLPQSAASSFLYVAAFAYVVLGINRALVGDILLIHGSRFDGRDRDQRVTDAFAAALSFSLLAALTLAAAWALWPTHLLDGLIWIAPVVPAVLMQDTARYAYLSARKPPQALRIDLIWVGVQAAAIGVTAAYGVRSGAALMGCWGLGATAGYAAYLARARRNPLRGKPLRWFAETRHLTSWFTGSAIVGQLQVWLVATLLNGVLVGGALAVMRFGQYLILQPVQNLVLASMGLLVPRLSRLAARGEIALVRARTLRIAAGAGGAALILIIVVALAARPVIAAVTGAGWLRPGYVQVEAIALPIAVQSGLYLMQIPFTASLRGLQRARSLFLQYLLFSAASLVGLWIGAHAAGLRGAAWGLTLGASLGLVVMVALWSVAIRTVHSGAGTAPRPASCIEGE